MFCMKRMRERTSGMTLGVLGLCSWAGAGAIGRGKGVSGRKSRVVLDLPSSRCASASHTAMSRTQLEVRVELRGKIKAKGVRKCPGYPESIVTASPGGCGGRHFSWPVEGVVQSPRMPAGLGAHTAGPRGALLLQLRNPMAFSFPEGHVYLQSPLTPHFSGLILRSPKGLLQASCLR